MRRNRVRAAWPGLPPTETSLPISHVTLPQTRTGVEAWRYVAQSRSVYLNTTALRDGLQDAPLTQSELEEIARNLLNIKASATTTHGVVAYRLERLRGGLG